MKIARRMAPIKPSATLAVTSRAKAMKAAGVDVKSFGAGEPDFDTPDFVVDAMVEAARSGATRYAPVAGVPALRDAVAGQFSDIYGLPFSREQIMVSVGGKHALYNLFQVLVDPGDEVIVPSPYWVSYPAQIRLAEGVPVHVSMVTEGGFRLDLDAVKSAMTDRTVGIVINSPSNPTGAVYDAETLRGIAALAEERDLWIITDDIYSFVRYGEAPFQSILRERPDLRERIIVVHGASKTYAMTGWRIGFVGASEALIKKLSILQGQMTSNAAAFAQAGALAAVRSDHAFLQTWLAAYDARRQRIVALLNALEGVHCATPGGAFYVFPDFRGVIGRRYKGETITSDLHLAQLLLEHAHVALVPGAPFGAPGFMRLSYACSMEDIEEGLQRIGRFIAALND
jgi:aspartate aminotransferase